MIVDNGKQPDKNSTAIYKHIPQKTFLRLSSISIREFTAGSFLVLASVLVGACLDQFAADSILVKNARLVPQSTANGPFTREYWLRLNEPVDFFWDGVELSNPSGRQCDLCNPQATSCVPSILQGGFGVDVVPFTATNTNPKVLPTPASAGTDFITDSCRDTSTKTNRFELKRSGAYSLVSPLPNVTIESPANNLYSLRAVDSGGTLINHQLEEFVSQDATGVAATYWQWTIVDWDGQGNHSWSGYFSPRLRISDIKVFKGNCVPDPSEGNSCLPAPGSEEVKPARVFFLPYTPDANPPLNQVLDYQGENNLRCYAQAPSASGAYINVQACRTGIGRPAELKEITPAYVHGENNSALRWVVDFGNQEVTDAYSAQPGEKFVIQFKVVHR